MEGDVVKSVDIEPKQHFTQPPARFSEATLIRTLEEMVWADHQRMRQH